MFLRQIAVVGAGYVGLTTAACLASLGYRVVCADIDRAKVERLAAGEVDLPEPGLGELVRSGLAAQRLAFVVGARTAVLAGGGAQAVFLCVPTPMGAGGAADLTAVESVVREIGASLPAGSVLVNKSTVPIGTAARTAELLGRDDVSVVSNPEFLRVGTAVRDFLTPDRIVVGADRPDAAERVAALYAGLDATTVLTDAASAEMIKYAANGFLAIKLSYANALAELCERLGADVTAVTRGIGRDHRIGGAFLEPGPGWGGSCLPKDAHAMLHAATAADVEFPLLSAAIDTNTTQHRRMVEKVRSAVTGRRAGSLHGSRLGLLGLAFKAGTDATVESPALAVAALLREAGAELVAHDPGLPAGTVRPGLDAVELVDDAYLAAKDVDALVVLTEWPQFRELDWVRIAGLVNAPVVVDTRNLLDPDVLRRAGLRCIGLGRREPRRRPA
jgi:UDPglucose 6-dehydrogenase